ncbi:MAG: hypothetical protein J0M00_01365 [Burkholderiales bacterium]|nr:hypothetical protein [Burkholderiales bacterium]
MVPFKNALCLLAMLVAYGIAGRMDYDDAVMLEQAQQEPAFACSHVRPSNELIAAAGGGATVTYPTSDGPSTAFSSAEPDTGNACASASR